MSKKSEILNAVTQLCQRSAEPRQLSGQLPDLDYWPKTREISDLCDTSIYVTRTLLLQLVEEGKVIKSPHLYSNSLRWYINPSR